MDLATQHGPFDYADSFEVPLEGSDHRTPEQFMRDAMEGASGATRATVSNAWRHILRFQLDPGAPGTLFGARVISSTPDAIEIRADGPLLRGTLIGRRSSDGRMSLTTMLNFHQRTRATVVWTALAPVHRRVARQLLERTAANAPA